MLDELISAYGSNFLVAALGVSLGLLCLFIVLWILRNRAPSPFVRGGRNRQPRLQVLDAAAIDTRRRIVLIRRDNVEHLVMIGGPTDLVIESGIGDERHYLTARALQTAAAEDAVRLAPQIAPQGLSAPPASAPTAQVAAPSVSGLNDAKAIQQPTSAEREPARAAQSPVADPITARASAPVAKAAESAAEPFAPGSAQMSERRSEAPVKAEASAAIPSKTVQSPHTAETPAPVLPAAPVLPVPSPAAATNPSTMTGTAAPAAAVAAVLAPVPSATSTAPSIDPPARSAAPVDVSAARLIEEPEPVVAEAPSVETPYPEPISAKPGPVGSEPPQIAPRIELPVEPAIATASPATVGSVPAVEPPTHAEFAATSQPVPGMNAEDVLDAARSRVLSSSSAGQYDAERFTPVEQGPVRPEEPQTAPAPGRDLSDFERVLEEEMALHIAADPGPSRQQTTSATPIPALLPETRADRPRPPIGPLVGDPRLTSPASPANPAATSAPTTEEPNLQNEIARIFGEMSASRNP